MDIRTKLILALVSVSLASMAILGLFAFQTSASLLQEISVRQLDALAESKKNDLLKVYGSWKTQVRLIGSRTQLRIGLRDYQRKPQVDILSRMDRIMNDALSAADNVARVTLFGTTGDRIVSVGTSDIPYKDKVLDLENEVTYTGSFCLGEDEVQVRFHYPLHLEDKLVGTLEVVINAVDLATVTDNFTGLGKTGEVLTVMKLDTENVAVLNSVRHKTSKPMRLIERKTLNADMIAALDGKQEVITSGLKDYRGVDVWSATRYLPGLDWGLIVKVDAKEERERADTLRDHIVDLALALSAFAVVGGTLLGIYLARPVQDLARVVHELRGGNLDVRAEIKGDDEVAYLSESLNQLIDDMQAENKNKDA